MSFHFRAKLRGVAISASMRYGRLHSDVLSETQSSWRYRHRQLHLIRPHGHHRPLLLERSLCDTPPEGYRDSSSWRGGYGRFLATGSFASALRSGNTAMPEPPSKARAPAKPRPTLYIICGLACRHPNACCCSWLHCRPPPPGKALSQIGTSG